MNDTNSTTALVAEQNLVELKSTLDKLARKAAKLGLAPITYTVGRTEDHPYFENNSGGLTELTEADAERLKAEGKIRVVYVRFHEVTVTGETPRLAGWEFAATLQHLTDDKGEVINLLRVAPGFDTSLPTQYRTATPENCDHCHKFIRTRKETFVVRNTETGEWKQVGRNCLVDFLFGKDPQAVVAALDLLLRIREALGRAGEENLGGGRGAYRYSTEEFLAVVSTLITKDGWTSRGKARLQEGLVATADAALRYLNPPFDGKALAEWRKWKSERPVTDEEKETARKALEFARETLSQRQDRSDYEHNLYVATIQETLDHRLAGITASLIPYYLKEVERRVIRETELKRVRDSKHIGQVGERRFFEATVLKIITVGEFSQWGASYLHKLVTDDGDLVIWFSSNSDNNLKPGQKYAFKATITKHDIRENVQQTQVNRLTELTEEQAAKELKKAAKAAAKAKEAEAVQAKLNAPTEW